MKTRTCRYCHEQKPLDEFEVANRVNGKVYRRWKCRDCKSARQRERRHSVAEWFEQYKQTLACSRCGYDDHRALEFHHTGHKNFDVSSGVCQGRSKESILDEIKSCKVLCANCHKIEHYKTG